ncbi:DUF1350 family protein [Desertifilum sp. FACHB-1129]|uniref:DUF1350 domain-containing protein n=1 Tax=Desertifilum tharense IPPAS B-1220 TaxID=1781255 RepID=A0A1E5QIP7_9CYAN|nr:MULTISPECIES: DUF1350 family protein [Cyanophyceae]MCD8488869.1 DUF1350 family protein [Desertifilum sp.]MDA0210540.1 DUF1350 family protein [Cyanobacteria bacterium FC1]MBD2311540.1 DUF1350 family protein [Desertifilum sp. FACHB-1129]MBD2323114.1 DUF1350 family protein [Desertifilum sp. FACHB-866]MBD2332959.1 DUF1350 family protein [Desertifilum sp. FACHB-868]
MDWQEVAGNWVIIPRHPIAIVHFLGGAFVATAPQLTYRWLLEQLAHQGYAIIATPFVNTLDHGAIARSVLNSFETALDRLQATAAMRRRYLPIYGLGHSMGCKLHLLINSLFEVERAGNILISYNNYPASQAIPFIQQFNINPAFNVEFTPGPIETNTLIAESYPIRRNLLVKFTNDTIDQTTNLFEILQYRYTNMVSLQILPGSHVTPLGQDIAWATGREFTAFDALGQWVKQEFLYREQLQLKKEILRWLNPALPG